MSGLLQDLRYALRQLRKSPGFSFAAVLTLGLGIAVNVNIFSAVNGLILRPLPVPHPQQIAVLAEQQQGAPLGVYFLSYPELLDLREQAHTFSDLFAYENTLAGMSADNIADHFVGSYVSGNYFSGLGVKPARAGFSFRAKVSAQGRKRRSFSATRIGRKDSAAVRASSASKCWSMANRRRSSAKCRKNFAAHLSLSTWMLIYQ
jgi:hypothetical protein